MIKPAEINPKRKDKTPKDPKKCIGLFLNLYTKLTDSKSKNPLIYLSIPNLVTPYLRLLWLTSFSPILLNPFHFAKWNGFNKIGEKEVNHNRRKYGVTKFGMERYIRGFLDLLSVSFVYRFRKRPMHFFGSFGVLSFLLGFISAGFIIYEKISKLSQNVPLELIRPVTDQPLFYIALLAIIIGVQLFLVGFLSELIIQINSDKKGYKIEKTGNAQKK